MIYIIPLKTSLLNLKTTDMEFQVKFILYVTANFRCSTMKYVYRSCWVPILCDTEKLGELNLSKYVSEFLENRIKLKNVGDQASVFGCMFFSVVFYIWSDSHMLVRKYLHTRIEELQESLIGRRL
ncbi:hypothetical protein M9H77_07522 [Catharanthus roseus]|uniref:Uncharacterized protein n=1 Tax=Catharanthus roseus TaxID=4058 RepID=A0ACC0BVF0_CATRO|nr:hypothetical protein M9H77_07522 [Catharanthus roseus]